MSDRDVADALRSTSRLVVVQAPAGCGKTFQGAEYAAHVAAHTRARVLVLTHTHAAREAFHDKTKALAKVSIKTLDGFVNSVASVYHRALDLPADVPAWARSNSYDEVASRVADLLRSAPTLCAGLVDRFPTIVFDEHQDASASQHTIALAMHAAGAHVRFFGDPMQMIYSGGGDDFNSARTRWAELVNGADAFVCLDTPHRWSSGSQALGRWVMDAHARLQDGLPLDLSRNLPPSVTIIREENLGAGYQYRPAAGVAVEMRRVIGMAGTSIVLTPTNAAVSALYGASGRSVPIWEGHTREHLDALARSLASAGKDPLTVCELTINFLQKIAVGLRKPLAQAIRAEVAAGCAPGRGRKHARELARHLVLEPNHRGVGRMLGLLLEMSEGNTPFQGVHFRHPRELREAIQLAQYDTADECLAVAARVRSHSRSALPPRTLSTIHKSKGLEADNALVVPLDTSRLPADDPRRCLLYVGISRARSHLSLVVPRESPSPLVKL